MPPPNHSFEVTINLVLKCIAGILGFFMWATTEIPVAQYIPFFSAPKIFDLNFFGKTPETVDLFTPTLSKTFPPDKRYDVPPPSFFLSFSHSLLRNLYLLFSKNSNSLQILFCKYENQLSAILFLKLELIIIEINYFALMLLQKL